MVIFLLFKSPLCNNYVHVYLYNIMCKGMTPTHK